jgi:hypothetical protein
MVEVRKRAARREQLKGLGIEGALAGMLEMVDGER